MSFSTARYSRLKVAFSGALLVAALAGCASSGDKRAAPTVAADKQTSELVDLFEGFGEPVAAEQTSALEQENAAEVTDLSALDELDAAGDAFEDADLEIPEVSFVSPVHVAAWDVIQGGSIGHSMITGKQPHALVRPVAVSVRGEYVYIVDEGAAAVLRYDMASRRLDKILDLRAEVMGTVADIYVNPDFSFYLTDTDRGRVLFYDRDGRLLQTFKNYFNMVKPVAVTIMPNGDLVVADGHYDHLLRFNSAGMLLTTYGGRGSESGKFLNITVMASGPDGMYVGARVGRHVQVVGEDGMYRYSFEGGELVFPSAIVVDGLNRSYVADYMDNNIKVFDRGRLVTTIGGHGGGPGKFMRITDMWLDGEFLYVVDSLNARIQIGHLLPE